MQVKGGAVGAVLLCVVLPVHVATEITSPDDPNQHPALLMKRDVPSNKDPGTALRWDKVLSQRHKRQASAYTNRDVNGFSEEEKNIFVREHNKGRAKQGSSDMMYMYWNDELAALAQSYVQGCSFEHSPKSMRLNVGEFGYVGENLYASSGSYDPASVVKNWYDEIADYNYASNYCPPLPKMCGHYTQIVWATSYAVGCGVRYCSPLHGVSFDGFLVSCNYGPGGNYRGMRPYKKGEACSACPLDTPYCVDNLCAKNPVIGTTGGPKDDTTLGDKPTSKATPRGQPFLLLIGGCLVLAVLSLDIFS